MMFSSTAHKRINGGLRIAYLTCLALTFTGCGLELASRSALHPDVDVTNPTPTPTPTASTAPDSGPTSTVSGNFNNQTVSFPYVLLNVDSQGNTALEFLSYDPCLWVETHSVSTFPQNFNTLIVELVSVNAAPGPGVYTDVSGTGNTASQSLDPNSSYGSIAACKGTWTALSAGATVTISSIDTTQNTASGSVSALLEGGGIFSGTFTTTSCASAANTNFAGDGPDACTSLQ